MHTARNFNARPLFARAFGRWIVVLAQLWLAQLCHTLGLVAVVVVVVAMVVDVATVVAVVVLVVTTAMVVGAVVAEVMRLEL